MTQILQFKLSLIDPSGQAIDAGLKEQFEATAEAMPEAQIWMRDLMQPGVFILHVDVPRAPKGVVSADLVKGHFAQAGFEVERGPWRQSSVQLMNFRRHYHVA